MAELIRVRAKKLNGKEYSGYYGLVLRKPGDVFDLTDETHFSDCWMEKVSGETPKTFAPGEPTREELIADGHITEGKRKRA